MPQAERRGLLASIVADADLVGAGAGGGGRWIADATVKLPLARLAEASSLDLPLSRLHGRSVLIATTSQLAATLAAIELDGVARRILLCAPDVPPAHLRSIMAEAAVDAIVTDGGPTVMVPTGCLVVGGGPALRHPASPVKRPADTEWVLFTSGTTGRPKLVVHTLASLLGVRDAATPPVAGQSGGIVPPAIVWGTFYDVRRYGGLTILLRALLGGSMVLSDAAEPVGAFLRRIGRSGVTHLTGTPSHWRRALMSPLAGALSPAYVRLSGEAADPAILEQLGLTFPAAKIVHAFATTEAGLGFEVHDGQAGFPAACIGAAGPVDLRVVDGTLRIRSARTASRYLGDAARVLRDAEGFVDTGDIVLQGEDRCYLAGRREGVINVGGQKVYPEEVEAVINTHPDVRMSRVWARKSPVTGALVAADIVLRERRGCGHGDEDRLFDTTRREILSACRRALPAHKVPASLRHVAALEIAPSGKLARQHA